MESVTSAGVSVGRHDHVRGVLEARGTLDFWRIAIQPGKPLAVGELLYQEGGEQLVVGFDLDMTLIDSRPGIAAVWDALSAETGVAIDSAAAVSRLGPPLDEELALWFPADQVAVVTAFAIIFLCLGLIAIV